MCQKHAVIQDLSFAPGKPEPGDTVEREIVGPAGEKEVEVGRAPLDIL